MSILEAVLTASVTRPPVMMRAGKSHGAAKMNDSAAEATMMAHVSRSLPAFAMRPLAATATSATATAARPAHKRVRITHGLD